MDRRNFLYATSLAALAAGTVRAESVDDPAYDYLLLATIRTSTMQKEIDQAAAEGYRFRAFMAGDTAVGGGEIVAVMMREKGGPASPRFAYKLLDTQKTSTMQKEIRAAGEAGFEYRDQTVHGEVHVLLERTLDAPAARFDYELLATSKTSTMQKELQAAGDRGFALVGVTVAKTAFGGDEVVSILSRRI